MSTPLSLTLSTGQVLAVSLNLHTIADQQLLTNIARAQAKGKQAAEIENRTYHMGTKPTPGLDYNDCLTARLKRCATTVYAYLELPVHKGGLRHKRIGKTYHITERDVRRFEGEEQADA